MENNNTRFRLKVSEYEKHKDDCAWYKEYRNKYLPANIIHSANYQKDLSCYRIINNDIRDFKQYLYKTCSWYGEDFNDNELEEILPYNRLYTKRNVLVGDFLKLVSTSEEFKAVLLSSAAIKEKDDLLKQEGINALKEKVELALETDNMSGLKKKEHLQENTTQPDMNEIINKPFKTKWELMCDHALKYAYLSEEVKAKATDTWIDVITVNKCCVKVGMKFGEPTIEVINPLKWGYIKSPDEQYAHKGEAAWSKTAKTLTDVLDEFDLTEEEIEKVSNYSGSSYLDKRHNIYRGASPITDNRAFYEMQMFDQANSHYNDKNLGLSQSQGTGLNSRNIDLIWVTHLEFKAYQKVYFRSYLNEYNDKIVELFTEEYKIPKYAKKEFIKNDYGDTYETYTWEDKEFERIYTLEVHWIPRRYEMSIIGQDIVKKCRQVPMQPINMNRPYKSFSLSYKGLVFEDRNAASVSLIERALPLQHQYMFVKLIQNRELARYKSYIQSVNVDKIPEKLGQDAEGNYVQDEVAVWYKFLSDNNIDLYSGSQRTTGGLSMNNDSPGSKVYNLGSAQEILNLQTFLSLIDQEISFVMGISPQREAQFDANSNVTDNQNAISLSHNMTKLYIFRIMNFWREVLNEYLQQYIIFARDKIKTGGKNHYIHYITPAGVEELFEVTEEHLYHNDVGVYVTDSSQEQLYHQTMIQMVHAFSQNAGEGIEAVSEIVKLMASNASAAEIHDSVVDHSRRRQQEMKQNAEQESIRNQQMMEQQAQQQAQLQQFEINKIVTKEIERRITELAKAEINATKYAQAEDINKNNEPDSLEKEKLRIKDSLEREKFEFQKEMEREKLNILKSKKKD